MKRILWKTGAGIMGFLAVCSLLATVGELSSGGSAWPIAAVVTLAFGTLMAWMWRKGGGFGVALTEERQRVAHEAARYFDHVNAARAFPPSPTSRIIERPGRTVLASCNARLLEFGTERARGYVGTRVKIGSIPVYLGKSSGHSKTVVKDAVQGELAATTKALIFNGETRSIELAYDKIVSVDIALDGITVAASDRTKPFTLLVPNGVLWGTLLRNLVRIELTSRDLPAGVNLQPL